MADLACQACNAILRDLVSFPLLGSPRPSTYLSSRAFSFDIDSPTTLYKTLSESARLVAYPVNFC